MEKYLQSCKTEFWKKAFKAELDYILRELNGTKDALAENVDFTQLSFDAVIYVASLQFIEKYKEAIKKTAYVLEPGGKLLAMLLNPQSEFFKEKVNNPASYVNKIRHTDLGEIERTIAEYFSVQTKYFLGIKEQQIFESQNPDLAGLYIIKGKTKT